MVDDTEGDDWLYRRDSRIRRSVDALSGAASTGELPVLAAEVQLLYKSGSMREKDIADFEQVHQVMSTEARSWLRDALTVTSASHPWIAMLE